MTLPSAGGKVEPRQSLSNSGSKSIPKILLVDDDPNVVASLTRFLRPYRLQVLCAYHGMQGIWLATTEKPNLIITDLSMPWTAGEDLIETLVCHPATRDIPIIVLTGKELTDDSAPLHDARLSRIFFKPTPAETIFEEVKRLIPVELRASLNRTQPRMS